MDQPVDTRSASGAAAAAQAGSPSIAPALFGWGILLGIAAGGFFDAVLLHQILEAHHVVDDSGAAANLRILVLWDSWFHGLMYVFAALALWRLWKARRRRAAGFGAGLAGAMLIGFGCWHLLDTLLSHWLLGIHRLRGDGSSDLAWDALWVGGLGMLPIGLGGLLTDHTGRLVARTPRAVAAFLAAISIGMVGAGWWAMQPPPGASFTTVVFLAGTQPSEVFAAIAAADARLVWSNSDMGVVMVDVDRWSRWSFYRHGAIMVSGAGTPAGCITWARL